MVCEELPLQFCASKLEEVFDVLEFLQERDVEFIAAEEFSSFIAQNLVAPNSDGTLAFQALVCLDQLDARFTRIPCQL